MVKRTRVKKDKNKKNNNYLATFASVFFLLVVIFILYLLYEHFLKDNSIGDFEGNRNEDYCRMVHLFKQTDGKEGWPDYRNIYYTDCVGTKTKKR